MTDIYTCPHCHTANRLPLAKLTAGESGKVVCGRCKQMIFPPVPVQLEDAHFDRQVLQAPLPVLVDFWAPWCGPCRAVAPTLEKLASQYAGQLIVAKLNVDENPQTASHYGIRSIPTMMLFRHGQVADTVMGALPLPALQQKVQTWLS